MPDQSLNGATLDGFLDNQFKIFQPRVGSHRSGLDAILLAACVPQDSKGRIADFGSGCGVAGMAAAQRCTNIMVDLIEVDQIASQLTEQSLALFENAHLADRVTLKQSDVTTFKDGRYNHIIANPPYNDGRHQPSPTRSRAAAHVMDDDLLENWLKAAMRLAEPKAQLTLILRAESLGKALALAKGRFGGLHILPVHPKANEKASRVLIQGTKASKASTEILPPLVIHEEGGSFTKEAEDIFRGRNGIHF